jgi:hypothetical protein
MAKTTKQILSNRATPYTVTRGKTGAQMDKTPLVPNMPLRKPTGQALRDIEKGRNLGRDLSPGKKEGA